MNAGSSLCLAWRSLLWCHCGEWAAGTVPVVLIWMYQHPKNNLYILCPLSCPRVDWSVQWGEFRQCPVVFLGYEPLLMVDGVFEVDSLLSWCGVIPAKWSQDHHFRSGLRSFPFKTRFSTHDVSLRSWSFLDRDKRLQEPSRVSTVSGVHSNQDKYLQKMFRLICALNLIFGATLQGRPEKQVPLWFMVLA